jgi:hypothetical protein
VDDLIGGKGQGHKWSFPENQKIMLFTIDPEGRDSKRKERKSSRKADFQALGLQINQNACFSRLSSRALRVV